MAETIWTAFFEPEHLERWSYFELNILNARTAQQYVAGRLRWPNFTIWTAFFEPEHLERWSYFELNIPNARTAQQLLGPTPRA